ncbi:MAG TPA: LPS assembly protein LptD [Candidatus Limnocylindrales bacterium]|nr:LPS assembly protein LptD [Candidatus Limnocylindrales bacterium]
MALTALVALILAVSATAQENPPSPPRQGDTINSAGSGPNWQALPGRDTLKHGEWFGQALNQDLGSPIKKWDGHAEGENSEMILRADHIEYNTETGIVTAVGNVYYHHFLHNQQIWCDRMEYDTDAGTGKWYNVRGETNPRTVNRRGVLSGASPFHFEGEWAERLNENHFILYNGWVTNCKLPNPWWRMKGPKFDIVRYESAKSYKSWFYLRGIPLFYTPYFYHSLEREPRHSGFLIPNFVPRSQRGVMVGLGYFWAINPSYDLTYRFFDYNTSAFAHHVDFRGKPNATTDYDFILYGVQDRAGDPKQNDQRFSGLNVYFMGHSALSNGWFANGVVNYVSSFRFRQEWSESYNEAIGSEIHSVGFVTKSWSNYTFDASISRLENFENTEVPVTEPDGSTNFLRDAVLIHKLPDVDFSRRDTQLWNGVPLWFSFYSDAGLLYRSEPIFDSGQHLVDEFQTREFMPRLRFAPHLTSALHLGPVSIVPSIGIDETFYGENQSFSDQRNGTYPYPYEFLVNPSTYTRSARDLSVDVIFPSFARVFNKKTVFGDKLKHVIEPRATYKYVTGIGEDFNRAIRFDEQDLLSNTSQLQLSLTNRLYAKRGDNVHEIFTWELMQNRYFDPTFGGAVLPGAANLFAATADLTAYAFVAGPRSYSPIASILRASPVDGLGIQWQADYDPFYGRLVDTSLSVDYHWKKYFLSAANFEAHSDPILAPYGNQYHFRGGFGDPQHRGWNAGVDVAYDYRTKIVQYTTSQVTYNTDCCGFSVQYRRFNFGIRDESKLYFSFSLANLGSVGTLRKQDRLF